MDILKHFDKVYCVNLDKRPDRWEQAQKEFSKIGIEDQVERWSGIENSDGNLGCTLSHLSIIKHCKENNLDKVLIFEDDVLFVETDTDKLETAFNELFEIGNWDLFYVGVTMDPRTGKFNRVTDNILRTNFAYTTHAYAVNSQAYDSMINAWETAMKSNHNIVDTTLYNAIVKGRKKSFVMDPIYAIQQPGYSDIGHNNIDTYEWMITDFNRVKAKGV
jgi:GR25 family glycosyltransferase involved in LPS biosynthesis